MKDVVVIIIITSSAVILIMITVSRESEKITIKGLLTGAFIDKINKCSTNRITSITLGSISLLSRRAVVTTKIMAEIIITVITILIRQADRNVMVAHRQAAVIAIRAHILHLRANTTRKTDMTIAVATKAE